MSNRLGGRQGTAYTGTNANQPPNMNFADRSPNQYDTQGYVLGDFWINRLTQTVYQLVALDGDVTSRGALATWVTVTSGPGVLTNLNADTGTAVPTNDAITIAGGSNIGTTATGSTLTVNLDNSISVSGSIAAGTTVTAGTGLTVSSFGAGVVQSNSSGVFSSSNGTDGQLLIGGGSAPVWANLTSTGNTIGITNGANSINLEVIAGGGSTISIEGDSGGPQVSDTYTFTGGTTGLSFAGAADTFTLGGTLVVPNGGTGLSDITDHNLMIGNGTSAVTLLPPSATNGIPLISQGAASNPAYGTAVVAGGGTGATTLTDHGVLVGQGTSAVVALTPGTNGQLLVGSTGANPVFATPTSSSLTYTTGAGTLAINITAPVSIANGGTNATSMANTNGVVYYDGTRLVTTAVGTATYVLTSNGAGVAPTFQPSPGGGSGSIVQQQRVTSFSTSVASGKLLSMGNLPNKVQMHLLTSLNITPTSASNILTFLFSGPFGVNPVSATQLCLALFEENAVVNSSSSTIAASANNNGVNTVSMYYQQVSGTTSLTNFSLYYAPSQSVNIYVNRDSIGDSYGGTLSYTFTITEVTP